MPPATLAFEARPPRAHDHKEEAVRNELGLTPARYHVLLRHTAVTRVTGSERRVWVAVSRRQF